MSCLPSKSKCEWFELRDFVKHYNESYGTAYERERCLDVEDNTRPQPEVLVKSDGCRSMVIERKSVVWPSKYAAHHDREHIIMSALANRLNPHFPDGAYALELHAADIRGNSEKATVVAEQIADAIVSAKATIGTHRIAGRFPIRWVFGINDECESRRGVTIVVISSRNLLDFEYNEEVFEGARIELAKQLQKAARKFADYESCIKTVVIQFFGEDFSEQKVEQMVARIEVPSAINQIWLAYSEPIADDEYEMKYHRVFPLPVHSATRHTDKIVVE